MQFFNSVDNLRPDETGVVGIFPDRQIAIDTMRRLQETGFSSRQLVLLGDHEARAAATAGRLGLPVEVEHGQQRQDVVWGLLVGGLIGLTLGVEAVALVGAAGLAAANAVFGGAAVGMASGGVSGDALSDVTASEQATAIRDELRAGHALVAVHAHGHDEAIRARDALKAAGARMMHEWALVPSSAQ